MITDETVTMPLYSRQAEEAAAGCVLINPATFDEMALSPSDFYVVRIGWIWIAYERLIIRHVEIDNLTVSEELKDMGRLEELGGIAYLASLINQVPTTLNAEYYAEIIKTHRRNRDRLKIANELARKAYAGDGDISDIMTSLATSAGVNQPARSLSDVLSEVYSDVQKRYENPCDVWGVSYGFPRLDKFTGGWQDDELTMLSGDSGLGKTYWATQMIMQAAQVAPVAFFSMEMGEKSIARRMLKIMGVDGRRMQTGFMEGDDWQALDRAINEIQHLPITLDSRKYNLSDFRAKCSCLVSEQGIRRVVVDYLLLMDVDAKDETEKTAKISGFMKGICKDLHIGILLIHSLNKGGMDNNDAEKSNMRGSGQVVYDADNVFMLTKFKPTSHPFEAAIMPSDHEKIIRMTIKKGRELDFSGGSMLYMRKDQTPKFTELDPDECQYKKVSLS